MPTTLDQHQSNFPYIEQVGLEQFRHIAVFVCICQSQPVLQCSHNYTNNDTKNYRIAYTATFSNRLVNVSFKMQDVYMYSQNMVASFLVTQQKWIKPTLSVRTIIFDNLRYKSTMFVSARFSKGSVDKKLCFRLFTQVRLYFQKATAYPRKSSRILNLSNSCNFWCIKNTLLPES